MAEKPCLREGGLYEPKKTDSILLEVLNLLNSGQQRLSKQWMVVLEQRGWLSFIETRKKKRAVIVWSLTRLGLEELLVWKREHRRGAA